MSLEAILAPSPSPRVMSPTRRFVTARAPAARGPSQATDPRAWLATREQLATVPQAIARIDALADRLDAAHDRRAIFVRTYSMQIRAIATDLQTPGRYADPGWMTQLTLDFIARYFDAFDAYDRGDRAAVPSPWLTAFDHATRGREPVVTDLLLAMNAHINHDLPLSVAAVGAGPQHKGDFTRFNQVLKANVNPVQDLLYQRYLRPEGSLASVGDQLLGPVDEWLAGQVIVAWRAKAWQNAVALTASGQTRYAQVLARADWHAGLFGTLGDLTPASIVKNRLL